MVRRYRPDHVPPDAMRLPTRPSMQSPRDAARTASANTPGIAPPPLVTQEQLDISFRLHLIATAVPPRYPVCIIAGDLVNLLNAFVAESRRADAAEARLRAMAEHDRPAPSN